MQTMADVALVGDRVVLSLERFGRMLEVLRNRGYRLVGPTVRDDAIVYDEIAGVEDLPAGWTDVQAPGSYRLERRSDRALFGYAVGPQSWKKFFFVPTLTLWQARRTGGGWIIQDLSREVPKLALIGARACDLHAIAIQDRVFREGPFVDGDYAARRREVFVVAVQCGQAGGTCFCVSRQKEVGTEERDRRGARE